MNGEGVRDRSFNDRRRWHRVDLAVPVRVRRGTEGKEGGLSLDTGQTVNLSAGGVYLTTSPASRAVSGEIFTISMAIPWEVRRKVPFSRIAGPCRVVRVDELSSEEAGRRQGVALAFCQEELTMLGTAMTPK